MNSKLRTLFYGILLGVYASFPALADDIEIYVTGGGSVDRPNILLLIDTSLSMLEDSTGSGWDPHWETYDDAYAYLGECDTSRIYWTLQTETQVKDRAVLLCTTAADQSFAYDANFVCDAGRTALDTAGKYTESPPYTSTGTGVRILEWRIGRSSESNSSQERWRVVHQDFTATANITRDCQQDRGIHGPDSTSSRKWMRFGGDHVGDNRWYTDDTKEPFLVDNASQRRFFKGNYVNWLQRYSGKMRITAVKEALIELLDGPDALHDVNIGLARFDHHNSGGMVIKEIVDLATNKTILLDRIKNIRVRANSPNTPAYGGTPLSESLYEMAAYYHGINVDYGEISYTPNQPSTSVASPPDLLTKSVAASRVGGTLSDTVYNSPIAGECQANHVIVLTDGLPTQDLNADNKAIANLPGFVGGGCDGTAGNNCLDEIAGWLYDTDHSTTYDNEQRVITHTVGFDVAGSFLEDTATAGHGTYHTVTNADDLVTALQEIIEPVIRTNASFTAPAVSVNAFNRAFHLDKLYFTLFAPEEGPHWDGNLKKFNLKRITDGSGTYVAIVGQDATTSATDNGFFKDTAQSIWTSNAAPDNPDGGKAVLGGAMSKLTASRLIKTDAQDTVKTLYDLDPTTTEIINTEIGLAAGASSTDRVYLINWARGLDGYDEVPAGSPNGNRTELRRTATNYETAAMMGDPLHSRPTVVTYGSADTTVFVATNDGFLHAIDEETGTEQFAFIPRTSLVNLKKVRDNVVNSPPKAYGIDGNIISWTKDADGDGNIEPGDGDFVYLFFGFRRGGSDYYALDVTNRAAPTLLWRIKGGFDNDPSTLSSYATGDFSELAESWSDPVRAKINHNGTVKTVLIFGGGYDSASQDQQNLVNIDTIGRGIFIVDATSGELLHRTGPDADANLKLTGMVSSIPAKVRVIDMDGNGLHDRLYVGDMGGRVWRFDIIHGEATATLVQGGLIASLGAANSSDLVNNRRFFNTPDVSLFEEGSERFLNIGIGSGYRAHPNQKIGTDNGAVDRFYMLRDSNVDASDTVANTDYTLAFSLGGYSGNGMDETELADLTDITNAASVSVAETAASAALVGKQGWFVKMAGNGEKVLAESVTLSGETTFTTFSPTTTSSTCDPGVGVAKIYNVSAQFATPLSDVNSDTVINEDDRSQTLELRGIPPHLVVLFTDESQGKPIGFVGTQKAPVNIKSPPNRTWWYQIEDL